MAHETLFFTTRSALFRPGDHVWNEVALYAEPLRRLLRRRYGWLQADDREDLVQEILLELKERVVASYDRSRGRFHHLLCTVVRRRVIDHLRRRRPVGLEEHADALQAPAEEEVGDLDLETSLLEAVRAARNHFTQGKSRDRDVLYALVDRLVHGRSNVEIARRQQVSADRVARLLRRGRERIFRQLLARELELPPEDLRLGPLVEVFKRSLREPRATARLLEGVGDRAVREALDDFLARFRRALPRFHRDTSPEGQELLRGMELVLEEGQPPAG